MAYTVIDKSTNFFTPKLYTGNGGTTTITGIPFEPDMTWIKNRSATGDNEIYDKVRGATYRVYPNAAAAQDALAQGLQAWTSDGFRVGTNSAINGNGNKIVSWNWKLNGQGSSNTAGSINTTYTSANTTSGCSAVKYNGASSTGATVGHGLGKVPKMIIVKNILAGEAWQVYHAALGNTKALLLNTSGGSATTTVWSNGSPNANTFTINSSGQIGQTGGTYIAYCFADIQGFSKIGSYVGNGNADGTFVYTGFKPAFIILKQYNTNGSNWFIFDDKRAGYNVENYSLSPDTNGTEGTTDKLDILSNGFKLRTSGSDVNGGDFIYMAFAEAPLVGSNNTPATAQ